MFALLNVTRWRGLSETAWRTTPRPHVVALSPDAERFIHWQRDLPCTDPRCLFGAFYTGFDFVNVDGRAHDAFRFKAESTPASLAEALALVNEAFALWLATDAGRPLVGVAADHPNGGFDIGGEAGGA